MKQIPLIASLGLLITENGLAQQFEWPAADDLTVEASVASASLDHSDLVLSIEYSLANQPGSQQQARIFKVQMLGELLSVSAPGSPFDWLSVADDSTLAWGVGRASEFISPGASRSGFALQAVGLPAILQYWVRGRVDIPIIPSDEPIPDAPLLENNSYTDQTVGVESVTDLSVPALLNRLDDLRADACTLGWISSGTLCTELQSLLDSALQSFQDGDNTAARSAVSSFDAEVTTARFGSVNENAYWLLSINAQFVLSLIPEPVISVAQTVADTYVRSGSKNANHGTDLILRVRPTGDNKALIQFSDADIAAATGSGTLVSATLELTIETNANNWGPNGRTIDAHRLTQAWVEVGATWNCANDVELGDPNPDCPGEEWEMGTSGPNPWVTPATSSFTITNGLTGVVSFDVTTDVAAFVDGVTNYGWIIKRTTTSGAGSVDFGSRESTIPARLVLEVQF